MKKQISPGTAAALCLLSAAAACNVTALAYRPSQVSRQLGDKLAQIQHIVDTRYVGEYDAQEMQDMAALGMATGIGDRWSTYLTAEQYAAHQLSFDGKLVGIGVAIAEQEQKMVITDVYDASPAAQAGLRPGDTILGAADKTVEVDGYRAVVDAIRGEENTQAVILVRHADAETAQTLKIPRKKVDVTSVRGRMLEGNIGLITIHDFDGGAEAQFKTALETLQKQGAQKLIFDVRFNGGGSVEVLAHMLDPLVPEGPIITLQPKEGEGKTYESDAAALEMPMAVLVNAESISAAEFFPAALQEYGQAVIVGDHTIGKGYSQRPYELRDGSALYLSDQKYYTPQGKNLAGVGIAPDIQVSLPDEVYANHPFMTDAQDTQLQAAIAALQAP